nr:hypothetical protein [Tanacetum cinerariifolium]
MKHIALVDFIMPVLVQRVLKLQALNYEDKDTRGKTSHGKVYDAKVSIRSKLNLLQTIQPKLSWNADRLESSTRGSSNSKNVRIGVRTEVCHEVQVCTETIKDQQQMIADLQCRLLSAEQTIKDQQQMIADLQCRLLSAEQVAKKLCTRPSDVDHLDKNDNQYDNVPIGGLDHQSMDDVSQCMNVDRLDKTCNDVLDNFPIDGLDHQSIEGINHCTSVDHISQMVKQVDESVAIDVLIHIWSQDVDHTSKDVGGTESMNVDQPYLVKNVKDIDEINIKTVVVPFQRQKFIDKVLVSPYVPLQPTKVKCKKRRRELKLNKSKRVIKTIVDSDGNEIQLLL